MSTPLKKNVVMIDNYDSFTWNLYEYLSQEGANVQVFRNDKITIKELELLKPDIILLSPGPGHPLTDSGICQDVILNFKGKIPIFGICMGEQCIFSVFGGEVTYAGEIVHGKTTPIEHDGKGMFRNVPQGIAVTRYHSLAGSQGTLPNDLIVTAKTSGNIIMGVRHKKYTIEGVQFHPESILTEEGHLMIRNILSVTGGYWEEHLSSLPLTTIPVTITTTTITKTGNESILDKIYKQRKEDVSKQQKIPGFTFNDFEKILKIKDLIPPPINFYERLKNSKTNLSLIAEIKRSSPSKGPIELQVNAPAQALIYAKSGASAISVLTEPNWFSGSIQDLNWVYKAIEKLENRPALLRKEFIFDKYQILEARINGADSILLIVKMLTSKQLLELYNYSISIGMEPLVEVSSRKELEETVSVITPKVIGVNNRDLHSFTVDLNTTTNVLDLCPKDSLLLALSGISTNKDVRNYSKQGVNGLLIGEALMKANNTEIFIKELLDTN